MKTLYEILEVSETASNEIIEKAYKVLAKKYHPDLWPQDKKKYAESKMKEINDAYDILSDETKRKEYDNNIKIEKQKELEEKIKEQNKYNQNVNSKEYNKQNEQTQNDVTQEEYRKMQEKLRKEELRKQDEIIQNLQNEYEQKYQKAYEGYLRGLGYKIKYKWTWKNYRDLLITILILAIICTILWFFPITHKWIIDFYESNPIIKTIIDVIGSIFVGIWNAICSIFNFR